MKKIAVYCGHPSEKWDTMYIDENNNCITIYKCNQCGSIYEKDKKPEVILTYTYAK